MQLENIDLSDNRFTGSIPGLLFRVSTIRTVSLVKNCFEGSLPSVICLARNLTVLALNGLHTSGDCDDYFFPFTNYLFSDQIYGSIPSCMLTLPQLENLQLVGNGKVILGNEFHGTLNC
jgi:hypothetical protein